MKNWLQSDYTVILGTCALFLLLPVGAFAQAELPKALESVPGSQLAPASGPSSAFPWSDKRARASSPRSPHSQAK
jgi:hypothetical protein